MISVLIGIEKFCLKLKASGNRWILNKKVNVWNCSWRHCICSRCLNTRVPLQQDVASILEHFNIHSLHLFIDWKTKKEWSLVTCRRSQKNLWGTLAEFLGESEFWSKEASYRCISKNQKARNDFKEVLCERATG